MSRWHSYVNSAKEILSLYRGEEPFPGFIKRYFSVNRKFGSADRKQVSHLCYCYFRLGKSLRTLPADERILTGLFLCSEQPSPLLEALKPEWKEKVTLPLAEKTALIGHADLAKDIFPWWDELSNGIGKQAFALSHLKQPGLFLRLRPGKEERVRQKLEQAGISYAIIKNDCLSLPNASPIDQLIELDKEAVVQDLSSQRVGELFSDMHFNGIPAVWDCCAASGGKSIMAVDKLSAVDLTVSDTRESILVNLRKRFAKAGITNYKSFVADLTRPLSSDAGDPDLLIADVPCSGSGTWGRNPEQLFYFRQKRIGEYARLQQEIVSNTIPRLKPGGYLLYITCSVFRKENEDMVAYIKQKFRLQELRPEFLKGYDREADTMFACLFKQPL